MKRRNQYELTTTRTGNNMPYAVYGKNKKSVLRAVRRKLRRGEKIILLERVHW